MSEGALVDWKEIVSATEAAPGEAAPSEEPNESSMSSPASMAALERACEGNAGDLPTGPFTPGMNLVEPKPPGRDGPGEPCENPAGLPNGSMDVTRQGAEVQRWDYG
jgi:hypothetical protein